MSTPFQYPPPPPPPPKPADHPPVQAHSSRGRFTAGENWRGRGGRGGDHGRGRGFPRGSGNHRGSHHGGQSRGPPANASGFRGHGNNRGGAGFHAMSGHRGNSSHSERSQRPSAVAPTPAFGFSLLDSLAKPKPVEAESLVAEPAKKKRKTNQLGLTPAEGDVSEEEVDEEAKFAALGSKLVFEYKGTTSSLSSAADIQAWIEERKRKWPTKARVEAKQKEHEAAVKAAREQKLADMRRLVEQSRSEKAAVPGSKQSNSKTKHRSTSYSAQPDDLQRDKRIARLERELEKLKAESVNAGHNSAAIAARLPTPEEEITTATHAAQEDQSDILEPSAKSLVGLKHYESTSASEESSDVSDDESSIVSSSDSEDAAEAEHAQEVAEDDDLVVPEEHTSHKPENPQRVIVRPRPQAPRPGGHDATAVPRGVCVHFYRHGWCNKGRSCRYKHIVGDVPRKSLYQRLVEQEKETENRKALETIKMLGQQGFFDDS